MYSGFDPNSIDVQDALDAAAETSQYIEEQEQQRLLREQQAVELQKQEEQTLAEKEDPRNKEGGGGLRGVVKEFGSAVKGGVQDTFSSAVTLPERAVDMFSGEMVEEQATEEGYGAEWDDWFVDDSNPIETKTWWGSAIRGLVHFGTMAAAIIPVAKATGVAALTAGLGSVGKGALIGAASDVVSKYSQEDNGLAVLRDRFNFIDTPLSTKDEDHPAMKTLKNVVEGMGIGAVFDGLSIVLGKGVKRIRGKDGKLTPIPESNQLPSGAVVEDASQDAVQKALAREQNVNAQITEKAQLQAVSKRGKFGGYKNKPLADSWQAAPTSTGKAYDVAMQRRRIETDWGSEHGSTDSLHTPVQLERTAMSAEMAEKEVARVLEDFMSDARIQAEIKRAKKEGTSLADKYGYAANKAREMMEGRNTTDLTSDEFWQEFDLDMNLIDGKNVWKGRNVVAADLVVGSLMREIRDMGIAGRELFDIADVADVDGPAKAMYEKIIAGLTQIKLSKMTLSDEFRGLGARQIRREVNDYVVEVKDAMSLAMKIAGDDADDSLFRAIHEVVSMSDDIHNLTDFSEWARKTLKAGGFDGKTKSGLLVKELQAVMVNSVLSGPKTSARAIMGTSSATFMRPMATYLGATLRGNVATRRAALASMNAMFEAIPESFKLFKRNLNAYWSGDVSTIKSRFNETTKRDETWKVLGNWVENSGEANLGDKFAFYTANSARAMNDNRFLTYSTKVMAATDDAFGYIMARAKAKEKAMRQAMDQFGLDYEVTPDMLKNAENRFLSTIMDQDGNITDAATLYAKKEATLTTDLTGFAKGLNNVFESVPWAKPFFLFARTGVNGLALTAKHTPGFNFFVKEFNDIAFAKPDDLRSVLKYGIETADELANAQALQTGRLAIGAGVMGLAIQAYMSGNLQGNGPTDRRMRQTWIDGGWKPRTVTLGGVQVGYDAFEPFNLILSSIADIGDHSQLMGEQWTEQQFQKVMMVIAQGITSKSYLAGIQQFVELFAPEQQGSQEKIIASLINNQVPLSSLRNELGKLFNPHMKELNSGWQDAIRNRNLITEGLAVDGGVPTKYDMLNGKPIRDWDFPTRMFNMFSPFTVNLDQGAGRKLLFESKYDLRTSTYSAPDGSLDLSDLPVIRSAYQKAIGDQNIEAKLDKLANNPKILNSLREMNADLNAGLRGKDPMLSYFHNKKIKNLFDEAKKIAWAKISKDPQIKALIEEEKQKQIEMIQSLNRTTEFDPAQSELLNMYR
tara:strand:- start:70 stop:3819 length:3750 start_codon:yes stop_codon:yes gene_type:complete